MNPAEIQKLLEQWANDGLVWVGFGTLVGLMAKAIMPGRDPGGPIATLLMGIGGTVIGCGALMFFSEGKRITPISPLGFLVATGGAFIILFFYKLLGGKIIKESGSASPERVILQAPHRRRSVVVDDDYAR